MNKEYIEKIVKKVNGMGVCTQHDINEFFKEVRDDKETREELAARLIKDCCGDISARVVLYRLFPEYIKNDGKMMEKCFGQLNGYKLTPERAKGSNHQYIHPTYDGISADMAFIDGVFYEKATLIDNSDMLDVTLDPSRFLKSYSFGRLREGDADEFGIRDVELLKNIALRSLVVEQEACKTYEEKKLYGEYALETQKAIEEAIEKAMQNNAEKEDDSIENA